MSLLIFLSLRFMYRFFSQCVTSNTCLLPLSANGRITGSELPDTPADLGDGTFAVYFARDKETNAITFEMTVSAKDSDDDTVYYGSAKDGLFSMWTTGDVVDATYDGLEAVDGFKLFDCDETVINLESWAEDYTMSRDGDVVTLDLGAGGRVVFTLGSSGVPESIVWGDVTGTVDSFTEDASLKGTLGKVVPDGYPCQRQIDDIADDPSSLLPIDQSEAESLIEGIVSRRNLDSVERRLGVAIDVPTEKRRLGSSTDFQMISMSIAAYNINDCDTAGTGWQPWFAIQNDNAYAQVCWKDNSCSIAMRGSDDGTDWYSNIVGGVQTSTLNGISVPSGFLTEYNKLKATSSWGSWDWARSSQYCANGVYATGHSLGGAMATLHGIDSGLSNVITFASPRIGGKNQLCGGQSKRYYLDAAWGSDPVPGLPPWSDHASSGVKLEGYLNWFSREYRVSAEGCGSDGGGGMNPFQHSSSVYKEYIEKTVG